VTNLTLKSVTTTGGNEIVVEAENNVVTGRDPTGHAETNCVRAAALQLTDEQLARSTLYTSTEPCCMCSGAIYWAGVTAVVYGCSDAALGAHAGNDFREFCDFFAHCVIVRSMRFGIFLVFCIY
jgi:tRNA(Arg) A34 adenosine deaminase TadA